MTLPSPEELRSRHVKLEMRCGHPGKEVIFAEPGYGATARKGRALSEWGLPVSCARADGREVQIEVTVPKHAAGVLRVYVVDPDDLNGGRKEELVIAGGQPQTAENFQTGRWFEQRLSGDQTADGKVLVRAVNLRPRSNAVVSILQWVEEP